MSTAAWATIIGVLGTLITAMASLGVALIDTRKTTDVARSVNGQLSEFMARWEAEHLARMAAEVELARLQERDRLRDEP